MHSCLYRGYTEHRRLTPRKHDFRYAISWLYLDLNEIPGLYARLRWFSRAKFAPLSFRPEDHLDGASQAHSPDNEAPLAALENFIRRQVRTAIHREVNGPIRVLTPLRQFGHYFSPICLYYCFENDDATSALAVVAEVTNTPWGEKHWYVLGPHNRAAESRESNDAKQAEPAGPTETTHRFSNPKNFHVSPFMKMGLRYEWSLTDPAEGLRIRIRAHDAEEDQSDQELQAGQKVPGAPNASGRGSNKPRFVASVDLQRQPLNDATLARVLLRFPLTSVQSLAAIYFEAARLWLKKIPYVPHPKTSSNIRVTPPTDKPPKTAAKTAPDTDTNQVASLDNSTTELQSPQESKAT